MKSVIMIMSLCWVSLCWVSLCWVSLCGVSFLIVILSAIMLSVIMLRVIFNCYTYLIVILSAIMLSVFMLSFVATMSIEDCFSLKWIDILALRVGSVSICKCLCSLLIDLLAKCWYMIEKMFMISFWNIVDKKLINYSQTGEALLTKCQ